MDRNARITLRVWRDATHFDCEDDYRTILSKRQSLSTGTFFQDYTHPATIIFHPLMKSDSEVQTIHCF